MVIDGGRRVPGRGSSAAARLCCPGAHRRPALLRSLTPPHPSPLPKPRFLCRRLPDFAPLKLAIGSLSAGDRRPATRWLTQTQVTRLSEISDESEKNKEKWKEYEAENDGE